MDATRWKVDLHAHTWHSRDCPVSPARLVAAAKRRGLHGIAITNHGRFAGHDEAQAVAGAEFVVIPGEEVFSSAGEIIGLFLSREIANGLTPEATCAAIRAQGGVVVVPHPFDRLRKGAIGEATLNRLVRAGLVDAVEVFNGRMMIGADNRSAAGWAHAHGLPVTVGSDGHSTWEYGTTYLSMTPFTGAASFKANLPTATPHTRSSPPWVHFVSTAAKRRTKARERAVESRTSNVESAEAQLLDTR